MATQSLFMYFTDAGAVVKTVMFILMAVSILSWTFIIQRYLFLKKADQALKEFEDKFWSGMDMNELYRELDHHPEGLSSIFKSGFEEYLRSSEQQKVKQEHFIEGIERAMRIANSRELEKLEIHLPFLASVGSTSPYIGLFGTVWGIMTSFHALGSVQQATIAMVAPGISEALIATAMGLFAAIPAVLAYNRFSSIVDRIANQYDIFQDELSSILHRQV